MKSHDAVSHQTQLDIVPCRKVKFLLHLTTQCKSLRCKIEHYSISLSSVGIWAQGRHIIKHLRSWTLTEHDTFALLPWCKAHILQRLREAWSDGDDSMINAHLRSHSHANFTHGEPKWLEEKLRKAASMAQQRVASVHLNIRNCLTRYRLTLVRILYSAEVGTKKI